MLYIKRTQTSEFGLIGTKDYYEVIYRVMPLAEFTNMDYLMDNLCFLFNFGDTIKNNIIGLDMTGGNGIGDYAKLDYGEMVGNILKSFVFTEDANNASWAITINGKVLKDLIGHIEAD